MLSPVAPQVAVPQKAANPTSAAVAPQTGVLRTAPSRTPETAIDPAQQAKASRALRDDEAAGTKDPRRHVPAGPSPAFVETFLQQQSRTAFDPPDMSNPPDDARPPETAESDADAPPKALPEQASDRAERAVEIVRGVGLGQSSGMDLKG